jgi:hypothetical protein
MAKDNERAEQAVLITLMLVGLGQLIRHPKKTYQLVFHKVSWY